MPVIETNLERENNLWRRLALFYDAPRLARSFLAQGDGAPKRHRDKAE
jgi:hypothetical protein